MTRIMIIRHAEKHHDGSSDRGVDIDGQHAKHRLTVRGWQRAGALARFFAPLGGFPPGSPLSTPAAIFASAATELSPSLRAQETVTPLAELLGVMIDASHMEGEERACVAAMLASPQPVLVAWHHGHIVALAKTIAGIRLDCPTCWPDARFDVVWVLDRDADDGPWRFTQVCQQLFRGDSAEPI